MLFALLTLTYFVLSLGFLTIARKRDIIDNPNNRSSHTIPTVRGGGFIIPVAWIIYAFFNPGESIWFTLGLIIISAISFADDISPKPASIRFLAHAIAFTFLFIEVNAFSLLPVWGIIIAYILGIGIINAYNFMDGINGMTGFYSLSILVPLAWLANSGFSTENSLYFVIPAILVFGWFNFRKKALSFAGDVGSISMGYIIFFLMLSLFLKATPSEFQWQYIALLSVYGVDSTLTILYRLYLRENIFSAHRRHLYQQLTNVVKWPHLLVSALYASIQLGISFWLLYAKPNSTEVFLLLIFLGIGYIISYTLIHRYTKNLTYAH